MSNPRSASNAWAKIKQKLAQADDDSGGAAAPPTPKRAKSTPRKKAAAGPSKLKNEVKTEENGEADGDADDKDGTAEPETPKKTPRKRAPKKQDDGEGSPKKRGRPAAKKAAPAETTPGKFYDAVIMAPWMGLIKVRVRSDTNEVVKDEGAGSGGDDELNPKGSDKDEASGEASKANGDGDAVMEEAEVEI